MKESEITRATLGRIPTYLNYLKGLPPQSQYISATAIARDLGLGEVQVRKDLGAISGAGKPKIGYLTRELIESLKQFLGPENGGTIVVGAGRLGRALLDYDGFEDFGLSLLAAFDIRVTAPEQSDRGRPILPMEELAAFCREHEVNIGIIAVPAEAAQEVCNLMYKNGIRAFWCFAHCQLYKPLDAVIQYENLALSLAHLKLQIDQSFREA